MTNEELVLKADVKIEELKRSYIEYLNPIVINIQKNKEEPTLEELLKCQQLGTEYFNFLENFVGNSGLLRAHSNGKWVTGFAETCHSMLEAFIVHQNFLKSYNNIMQGNLQAPNINAYANMQRMVKEYLSKEEWQNLKNKFINNSLPITGFEYAGANDLKETPKWQLITGVVIGVLFALIILVLAILISEPTQTQFFIFRGMLAISLATIAAIIPGFLNIESRFQKFSIAAGGAIAVFIVVWLINPPALIGS